MKIELLQHASFEELAEIKTMVGEAFVTNSLFHAFGDLNSRRALVLRYMDIYTDYVYESNALYITEDRKGVIGLLHSRKAPVMPQMKMLIRLFRAIPYRVMKQYLSHIRQIADSNKQYASAPHIDTLFVCVDHSCKGKGYARQLVSFAKDYARKNRVPLLFDTDMPQYAKIYQHFGCQLYHQTTASNGITRYNLIWIPDWADKRENSSPTEVQVR